MVKTHGTLVLTIQPGESVYIGDQIAIEVTEDQGSRGTDKARRNGKPTRLRIHAPIDVKITRSKDSILERKYGI